MSAPTTLKSCEYVSLDQVWNAGRVFVDLKFDGISNDIKEGWMTTENKKNNIKINLIEYTDRNAVATHTNT